MTKKENSDRMARRIGAAALTLAVAATCAGRVEAQNPDVAQSGGIAIKNGGGVRGIVQNPDAGTDEAFEVAPTLGGKLVVDADEVRQTTVLRPEQISYRKFAPLQKDTVAAQLKIARWAKTNKLSALADAHFTRVVELDPDNEEAHKELGHVRENGVWVSSKEKRENSGMVRAGGRTVSRQEAEIIKRDEEAREAARYWKKEIQFLYSNAFSDGGSKYRETLRSVRNPQALSTVVSLYRNEKRNPEGRVLLVHTMSAIGNPAALSELGQIALNDPDQDVRIAAVEGICRKKTAAAEAIEFFRRSLHSDDPEVINSAAYALGQLVAERAVPDLISALVTSHKRQFVTGSDKTGATFNSGGGLGNFSSGGGTRVETKTITSQNEAVHQALVQIVSAKYATPVDFGYDQNEWIRWRRGVDQLSNFYPRRDR